MMNYLSYLEGNLAPPPPPQEPPSVSKSHQSGSASLYSGSFSNQNSYSYFHLPETYSQGVGKTELSGDMYQHSYSHYSSAGVNYQQDSVKSVTGFQYSYPEYGNYSTAQSQNVSHSGKGTGYQRLSYSTNYGDVGGDLGHLLPTSFSSNKKKVCDAVAADQPPFSLSKERFHGANQDYSYIYGEEMEDGGYGDYSHDSQGRPSSRDDSRAGRGCRGWRGNASGQFRGRGRGNADTESDGWGRGYDRGTWWGRGDDSRGRGRGRGDSSANRSRGRGLRGRGQQSPWQSGVETLSGANEMPIGSPRGIFQHKPQYQNKQRVSQKRPAETAPAPANIFDESVPEEVRGNHVTPSELCQPLYCKLCLVKSNAPAQAAAHYNGKNHAKKVRAYAETKVAQSGGKRPSLSWDSLAALKRPKLSEQADSSSVTYCEICNVSLNSEFQAAQHYQGKLHVAALAASKLSSATSETAEASTIPSSVKENPDVTIIETTNRQPDFRCKLCGCICTGINSIQAHLNGSKHADKVAKRAEGKNASSESMVSCLPAFSCSLCNVTVTSQENLNMHLNGQKHRAKMEKVSRKQAAGNAEISSSADVVTTQQPANEPSKDYSMYKTPSGQYYCSACNHTCSSDIEFHLHMNSRNHRTASAAKKFLLECQTFQQQCQHQQKQSSSSCITCDLVKLHLTNMSATSC